MSVCVRLWKGCDIVIIDDIREFLYKNRDEKYRQMQVKTIPNISSSKIIGVRTPVLRAYAKMLYSHNDVKVFMDSLPHEYFEEDQLHGFIISLIKDYDKCISELERFLPFVDNWATCDQMNPRVLSKNKKDLLTRVNIWIKSTETYKVRFAVKVLMDHFLDEDFSVKYPALVVKIESSEYYINMMRAWYFATALAMQYDAVIPFIEENRLDVWTHNKTIQKSVESYRITDDKKAYLRTLKRKN